MVIHLKCISKLECRSKASNSYSSTFFAQSHLSTHKSGTTALLCFTFGFQCVFLVSNCSQSAQAQVKKVGTFFLVALRMRSKVHDMVRVIPTLFQNLHAQRSPMLRYFSDLGIWCNLIIPGKQIHLWPAGRVVFHGVPVVRVW